MNSRPTSRSRSIGVMVGVAAMEFSVSRTPRIGGIVHPLSLMCGLKHTTGFLTCTTRDSESGFTPVQQPVPRPRVHVNRPPPVDISDLQRTAIDGRHHVR